VSQHFELAQADMRRAFAGGATGMFASACVWLAAGVTTLVATPRAAMFSLFFGGMLIHPLAILFAKLLGRSGSPAPDNPLTKLALESTGWMLLAIPLAFVASLQRIEWFFVAMLLTIGGRYLTFASLYGMKIYWACGAALAVSACVLALCQANSTVAAFSGGVIECLFAAGVFSISRREVTAPLI